MAHLLANHHSIPRRWELQKCRTKLKDCGGNWRNIGGRQMVRVRGFMVQSSASSPEKVGSVGYLVNECGWKVRRLVEKADEMRMVAQVQAEAFHVPVALFNDFFFDFFQAEVLSGLAYKLRSSPPNRYACLVAEAMANVSDSQKQLVGVVDVTVLRDQTVLDHLPPEAEEYLYVSGIAVLKAFRRQKIATVLLKACDVLSTVWGLEHLALRAYEDDLGARKLYTSAGYEVVSEEWFKCVRRLVSSGLRLGPGLPLGRRALDSTLKAFLHFEYSSCPPIFLSNLVTKTTSEIMVRQA